MDDQAVPKRASNVELQRFPARSLSLFIPQNAYEENEDSFISHTGPLGRQTKIPHNKLHVVMPEEMGHRHWPDHSNGGKNEQLLKSGLLALCNNPDCVDCPAAYKTNKRNYKASTSLETKLSYLLSGKLEQAKSLGKRINEEGEELHNMIYGDADGWARKPFPFQCFTFPILNPHTKVVQQWNTFFLISCLVAIFIDPLFFFVLSVQQDPKCIVLSWSFATAIAAVRSVTDFVYLLHMLLQFRLAYVAPESRVVGAGVLVDQPRKIAMRYLRGYFLLDLFVLLPLPQVMILYVIPKYMGSSSANFAKDLLRATVLLQYFPRMIRFLPLLGGQSTSGFIFESAWANFVINLLMFVLAGHVVGSCWYLFGLQRVNQCLRDACSASNISYCKEFIDCGRGNKIEEFSALQGWQDWKNNSDASNCFNTSGDFQYGIYQNAVILTTKNNIVTRYIYSLFWGFQQISTLAGNLVPSYFEWEVLFTMGIIGLGLLLFALLIGNMQNFLQALGRRRLEMQLRRRDVEQWMSHRRLPPELRSQVRQAERFSWAATRGVNEEELLENFPEDIQREIRRHFFKFIRKVRIFTLMDEPILDAVCERLRPKLYIGGSDILYQGGTVEKMVFIVRGKLENIAADGNVAPLSEGDVCGEELLTWYLEHSSVHKDGGKIKLSGQRLFSNRRVRCLTNVEAFVLRAADLEEVTTLFARFLRNPRVQGAIRYESPYWRNIAAVHIQVAWRYRQRRLRRMGYSCPQSAHTHTHARRHR